ncbi:MAG: FAD-dependent oxidoreductase [Ignavibacteriales bacterium]|nr:FAD-dependent oxidoreductase [Ignavibacteriales bacterium]
MGRARKKIIFDQNDSFWAKEILQANKPLEKNISADIAIIGGGYSGLSTAYHLKKYNPSLNVIILEAMHLGHGASGRHGGMILPQPPTESFEIAFDIDIHKTTYGLTTMNIKGIKNLLEEHRIDCDLKLDGFCHSIIDEEDIKYYQNYVAKANDAGIPIELWDAVKTQEKLGTNHYAASVYDPNGGSLHAVKFINALKLIAESLGVVIYENSEVTEIIEGKIIQLIVGKQASIVKTRNIVLATNGYTSKLGYFNSRILPVHAQSAVTVPLSPEQLENIGWESRLPFYDSKNYLYHLVLRDDNRIVVGGGDAEYYFRGDLHYQGDINKVNNLLMTDLLKIFPSLKGIKFENVWNGILCMTADEIPLAGVTGDYKNIYYALGYNGQGVNMSFLYGNVIAGMLCNKSSGWEKTPYYNYQSGYIPPEPFRWIGAKFMMEYYRHQDREVE